MRRVIARYPLEKTRGVVFAVDVSVWPRREAEHSPERGYHYQPSRRSVGQPIVAEWVCKGRRWSPKSQRTLAARWQSLGRPSPSRRPLAIRLAPSPLQPIFWLKPSLLSSRFTVESLRGLPVVCSRERRLSETVAARRSWTSSSRSFSAISSVFGGLPLPYSVPAKLPAGLC